MSLAQLAFDDIYGPGSHQDWTLSLSDQAPGQTRLVAAMPQSLLNGLRELLAGAGIRLVSVRPQLAVAIQAFQRRLRPGSWVLSHEPGRMSLAGLGPEGWHWVSSHRVSRDDAGHLQTRLLQELTLAGVWPVSPQAAGPLTVHTCAPTLGEQAWGEVGALQLLPWRLPESLLLQLKAHDQQPAALDTLRHDYGQSLVGATA